MQDFGALFIFLQTCHESTVLHDSARSRPTMALLAVPEMGATLPEVSWRT
jgi:hypothetical protein